MQEKKEDILVKYSAGEVRRDTGKIQCKRSKKIYWYN